MKIQKIWLNNQPKEHTFILFHNNILYSRKVSKDDFHQVQKELNLGNISERFFGLPISYLRSVEYREDSPKLSIVFNQDSTEEIEISDNTLRKQIFDFLKTETNYQSFAK